MKNWLNALARHYEAMRRKYPDDQLLIAFDIDGTILDLRHTVRYVLQSYDKEHETEYFRNLQLEDICEHETQITGLLDKFAIAANQRGKITEWYLQHLWTNESIFASHRPFRGALEVIRWFQLQPNTDVGLNTGRPDTLRQETLHSLNQLAAEYKVQFSNELLFMNAANWEVKVKHAKIEGIEYFRRKGYRVFAFIDNEPDNLKAVGDADARKEILLLHADTLFHTPRRRKPKRSVSGSDYHLPSLISEHSLPRHIQFVWHGVNDMANLREFIVSNVQWGEVDVRQAPFTRELILRHDNFQDSPVRHDEDFLSLHDILEIFQKRGKSIKLDLKDGDPIIADVVDAVQRLGIADDHVWFNANLARLGESGFRKLKTEFPNSIRQCSLDFLAPILISAPEKADDLIRLFSSWGINRFSVSWRNPHRQKLLQHLQEQNLAVNIYDLPNLEAFIQATLLLPDSVTADYNFPQWDYHGRALGEPRSLPSRIPLPH